MESPAPWASVHPPDGDEGRRTFLRAVLNGLRHRPRSLPCRYFYDARGSTLFEAICRTPEYYLTRAELAILEQHGPSIAKALGPGVILVELGSGSAVKTRLLLDQLASPAAYVPVDISASALRETARRHRRAFPDVPVRPVCDDFAERLPLPAVVDEARPGARVVFFPGSTIGNFAPPAAVALMARVARLIRPGGAFLVGVDLVKDPAVMEAAYNDAAGFTEQFNRNVLTRLRDELGVDVDPESFEHRAVWDEQASAIQSYLVSRRAQTFRVEGEDIAFAAGEAIHTESSHKYSAETFAALAEQAGLVPEADWTDDDGLFSVRLLRAAPGGADEDAS